MSDVGRYFTVKTIDNLVSTNGSILEAKEQYIAQQCNCISSNYKGLSKAIVEEFPWAKFYSESKREPGTIKIEGNGIDKRFVIGMFAQRYVSISKYNNDTDEMRLLWFEKCLDEIGKIPNLKSIAFLCNIGCVLAGGHWPTYLIKIEIFAKKYNDIMVVIYEHK